MFEKILKNVSDNTPLVHAITNYVTVNDCANIILASGGSPIMSDDENEVEEITSICKSLVINIGTLNERTIKSMVLAGKKANDFGHPVILDPVGAGASKLRDECVAKLLQNVKFSVIRGNISEIKAVYLGSGNTKGVDANEIDSISENNIFQGIEIAKQLSKKTGAVVAISGEIDIVTNFEKTHLIRNGHQLMTKITGSGCMLTAIIATYCGANYDSILDSVAAAVSSFALSGEFAYDKMLENKSGISSFKTYLMDYMGKMNSNLLNGGIKIESK